MTGITGDGPGHGHSLPLAARELRREVLHPMRHPDPLERRLHPPPALLGRQAAVGERQLDVLVHREVADQIEGLEDESDLPVADPRALGRGEPRYRLAVERVAALGRRVEQPENREQRRLAAARRPGDGEVLAAPDLEVNVRQRVGLDLVGVEHLARAISGSLMWGPWAVVVCGSMPSCVS